MLRFSSLLAFQGDLLGVANFAGHPVKGVNEHAEFVSAVDR